MTTTTEEIIPVDERIELRATDERYTTELHNLVVKNRAWLQDSLNWPQFVGTEDDTRQNILSNQMLHQRGYAKMFLIFSDNALVGVLSFNAIEPLNKTVISATGWMKGIRGGGFYPARWKPLSATMPDAAKFAASSLSVAWTMPPVIRWRGVTASCWRGVSKRPSS